MPASVRRRWTRAEVVALIDALPGSTPRYELVDGELLVTPSPAGPHGFAVHVLTLRLGGWLEENPVGTMLESPFDVELEPETLVQPDAFVVTPNEGRRLRTEMPARELLLAIEVLSPSSARFDRGEKRELYQRHVPEYWIIDLDSQLVERWRQGEKRPEIVHDRLEWRPAGTSAVFELRLPGFFARVLDLPV